MTSNNKDLLTYALSFKNMLVLQNPARWGGFPLLALGQVRGFCCPSDWDVILHIYQGSDSVVVYSLSVVSPIVSVLGRVLDCYFVVLAILAIILLVKRELASRL